MKGARFTNCLNPYFIGLPILIMKNLEVNGKKVFCLNPYFIGLPILIVLDVYIDSKEEYMSQSLYYWIIYSYLTIPCGHYNLIEESQSLFYWIIYSYYR